MFIYETSPIDYFVGAMSIDEYFADYKAEAESLGDGDASYEIAQRARLGKGVEVTRRPAGR